MLQPFRDLPPAQRTAAATLMQQLVQGKRATAISLDQVYRLLLTLNTPVFWEEASFAFTQQAVKQLRQRLRAEVQLARAHAT